MPIHKLRTHRAFSLFEAIVSIVILGVIGIICSSMLLQISKNIAYTKAISDSSVYLALLKIENHLQYAFKDSIMANGTPLNTNANSMDISNLSFASIPRHLLFGGGDKNSTPSLQNETLLPLVSLNIESHYDNTLTFAQLKGWQQGQSATLITKPKEAFTLYHITRINTNTIELDKKPTFAPSLIIPLQNHHIALQNDTLMLDNSPLLFDVLSFSITPHIHVNEMFLSLYLCVKAPSKSHCVNGGVWLDDIVEILP